MSEVDERDINPIDAMSRIAKSILQLDSKGFIESYRAEKPGKLIYDSEWCRLSLGWEGWDYLAGNTMHIRYGRLHAPNETATLTWHGENCLCWHRVEYALHFLDGRNPADASELDYTHSLIRAFREEEDALQKYKRRQPEWQAQLHLKIWHEYGQRLFDLFDLRKPNLWEQYRQFLKEVYDIKGRSPRYQPSLDKVC